MLKNKKPKKDTKKHKPNLTGVCQCSHCKSGRKKTRGERIIIKIKRRSRNWWNNKPEIKGGYTD